MAKRPATARSFGIELPDVANHLRTVMVALPPGHFSMGSSDTEEGHDVAEAPMHEVQIDYVFAIGAAAVTRDVFSIFIDDAGYEMGESAYVFEDARWVVVRGRGWRDPGFAQNGDHPVTCVSWRDAQAFLVWLNDRVGLTGQPGVYRLPSEAEWEYACRGGTSTPFSFGDTLNTDQANFNGRLTYGGAEASMLWRKATTPAGHLSANGFGVHDAHGNVWEWCDDVWNANYEGVPATGTAQLTGDLSARVRRGGCWDTGPHLCRSATRFRGDPQYRGSNTGFRLARTLS
jgi:formylglycine-generating enzyme required for sulfatase activity